MRKSVLFAIGFVLMFAVAAHAAEMKIAVFDVQVVAEKSEAIEDAKKEWARVFDPEKSKLEAQRTALEKKAAGMKKPSDAEMTAFRKEERDYTDKTNAFMRKMQNAEMKIRQEMDAVIVQAARDYAAAKGYTMILDSKSAPYYDKSMDVTEDLTKEANRVWNEAKQKAQQAKQQEQQKPAAKQ